MNANTVSTFYSGIFLRAKTVLVRCTAVLAFGVLAASADAEVVNTSIGAIDGSFENGIYSYKGIPYAQPPVGALRWLPPQPVKQSDKAIAAKQYGAICLQTKRPNLASSNMSEDCLTLNVWTQSLAAEKRPVMVWIHGGAFRAGSGITAGDTFANLGAVVVSINYRLGPLGFFSHESLPDLPANPGVLDMVAALEWVQKNIASFGGDPDNVTIFGVSAGGMAVNLLATSDRAKGLFHRAIAQSGYATWALPRSKNAPMPAPKNVYMEPAEIAESISAAVVKRLSDKPQTKAMLYSLDGAALVNALQGFQLPIIDGDSIAEEPGILFSRGQQHAVPYMSGGNSYEGSVMAATGISIEDYQRTIGSKLSEARKLYADDTDGIWPIRMFGDNRYLLSARVLGESMSKVSSNAWLYYIDYVAEKDKATSYGTTHGSDGYFMFQGQVHDNPEIQALSKRMQQYWMNFARNGNPNGNGQLQWPQYTREQDQWLLMSAENAIQRGVIAKKLDLLEGVYKKRVAMP